jgi:subtilisin family serine protease
MALSTNTAWLVQVQPFAPTSVDRILRRHGADLLAAPLGIWRVPAAATVDLIPHLLKSRALRVAEPNRFLRTRVRATATDPLTATEWWIPVVGADKVVPPGPGVVVTDVDSGLDVSHEEFSARPNTTALNLQTTTANEDEPHGTAVSSVIGAPTNGLGLEGVYPQANLQQWDASPSGALDEGSIIEGIYRAAALHVGVINLSLGGPSPDFLLKEAIMAAFGEGSLVVAASGNEFDQGNPVEYPASFPHVLTVAATTQTDQPAFFSSSSLAVDLAAPGVDIPVAVPTWYSATGYDVENGTSFSAPLVSGAAAWTWTVRQKLDNTQLFDLMRWSARDVGAPGWDTDTGFGVLNIPGALSEAAPRPDPQEPNEDIYLVKPKGLFVQGTPFLVGRGSSTRALAARLDYTEDPEDIFRVWVPGHRTLRIQLHAAPRVHLALWGPKTQTVFERGAVLRRDLIASRPAAKNPLIRATNSGRAGVLAYVDVWVDKTVLSAGYTLSARLGR